MARGDDRDRVAPVGRANRPHRVGVADLPGDIAVAAGLTEGDSQQRRPDLALEFGAGKVQVQLEVLPRASEVLAQLTGGFAQHGVMIVAVQLAQPHAVAALVLPEHGGQALATGHQGQGADGRRLQRESVRHGGLLP